MRKIWITVLMVVMLITSMLSIVACSVGGLGDSTSPTHTCEFNVKNTDSEYLFSDATCEDKAVYNYSCLCGKKGQDTFEYGEVLGHNYGEFVSNGDGTHSQVCSNNNNHIITEDCSGGVATENEKAICEICGAEYGSTLNHTHDFTKQKTTEKFLKSPATCQKKAEYYYSCDCGEIGVLSFEYGEFDLTAHNFNIKNATESNIKSTSTCQKRAEYYFVCACGEQGENSFEYGDLDECLFTNYVSDNNATDKEDGTKTAECDYGCGKTDTVVDLGSKINVVIPEGESYLRIGNYIYYGMYPQTIKEDGVLVNEYPSSNGYHVGSDGNYYAKVVSSQRYENYNFSNGENIQYNHTYYFKVEPIRWEIISEVDGVATIFCDSIIDARVYDDDRNEYIDSEIRAWLNSTFYNSAFNSLQQSIILSSKIDNSLESTGDSVNNYVSEDTNDLIYLLSRKEVNEIYDEEIYDKNSSDYALANGQHTTDWWLRSPDSFSYNYAQTANFYSGIVDFDVFGIAPVLRMRTDKKLIDDKNAYKREGNYVYFGSYPQSLKADDVLIASEPNNQGYYFGSDGEFYKRATARLTSDGNKFTNNSIIEKNQVYYFKMEPIKWEIISETGRTLTLLSRVMIYESNGNDIMFDMNTTNYKNSSIRDWLNYSFLLSCFNESETDIILPTYVDNGPNSTDFKENTEYCENTADNVYLLSYQEANKLSKQNRKINTSDYVRTQGVYIDNTEENYGFAKWWLRSPSINGYDIYGAHCKVNIIDAKGSFTSAIHSNTGIGVIPAMTIIK